MINQMLEKIADTTAACKQIKEDIFVLDFTIVNSSIIGNAKDKNSGWIVIDSGLKSSRDDIIKFSEKYFGYGSHPSAIILTHGHFDHIGSVIDLMQHWNVPVYAHKLEMPYLTGEKDYPQGDSTVDGGLVAEMSPAFPHDSINLKDKVHPLPEDGSVPGISNWRWIHTPGHTPGHVSFFRDSDRALIVGDAFTSVKQESLSSVLTHKKEISGPPAYLTTDWAAARQSVEKLARLNPTLAVTSHGRPLEGKELSEYLEKLVNNFEDIAMPEHGRYVE